MTIENLTKVVDECYECFNCGAEGVELRREERLAVVPRMETVH